ncbi:glycoside hydrolase family 16 protein [Frankia sp. AvcI1]|uniref:glycoside hydrolase family 16 protein n=1 Tax=Frankia sp. AvcI1 TaxID=573496 RepID=UPI00211803D6|nr:glycoside hydrolase family 16 protein [Frankia sp. AvcI1]
MAACGPVSIDSGGPGGTGGGSASPGAPASSAPSAPAMVAPESHNQKPTSSGSASPSSASTPAVTGGTADTAATDPPNPIWGTPVLVDSFNGTALDTKRWAIYDSPQVKLMPRSPENVAVSDGALRLTGWIDSAGRDVSGGVASRINLQYGRWEARVRAERGSGYSAVVLLWPQSEHWPTDGEIDILEVPDPERQVGGNFLHLGSDNRQIENKLYADFTQWHTVGVEWLPNRITYYLDGKAVWTVTRPTNSHERNMIPTKPMHMTLQHDRGCFQLIPCRNAQTPPTVSMYVDWIKIYRAPSTLL